MKTAQLDRFFEIGSKFVIVVPIILLILMVVFWDDKRAVLSQKEVVQPTPVLPTTAPTQAPLKLPNLTGPWSCDYHDSSTSAQIQIKNRQVIGSYTIASQPAQLAVIGDCVYNWSPKTAKGTKMCGIGQYLMLYDMVAGLGLGDSLSGLGGLGSTFSGSMPSSSIMSKIGSSCQKSEVSDAVFQLPKGIVFEETQQVQRP